LGSWKLMPASMPASAAIREPARRQFPGARFAALRGMASRGGGLPTGTHGNDRHP
jgi:hypothetical protein